MNNKIINSNIWNIKINFSMKSMIKCMKLVGCPVRGHRIWRIRLDYEILFFIIFVIWIILELDLFEINIIYKSLIIINIWQIKYNLKYHSKMKISILKRESMILVSIWAKSGILVLLLLEGLWATSEYFEKDLFKIWIGICTFI